MVKISFPLKEARCAGCGTAFEDGMTILGHGNNEEEIFCFECEGNDFINSFRFNEAECLDYVMYQTHDGSAFLSVDPNSLNLLEKGIYELEHFMGRGFDRFLVVRKMVDDEDVREFYYEVSKKNFILEKDDDYVFLFFPEKMVTYDFDILQKKEDYEEITGRFSYWTGCKEITYLSGIRNRVVGISNGFTHVLGGLIRRDVFDLNVWGRTLQKIEEEYKGVESLPIIRNYDDFSGLKDGIHVISYSQGRDFFFHEKQISSGEDTRKAAIKALTNFYIVEKGSSFSCLFFERTYVDKKREFVYEFNYTSPYFDDYDVDDYFDDRNYFRHYFDHFCKWTGMEEKDIQVLVHEKNGHVVGFITKDSVLADSAIARECYSGSLIKKSINELEEECRDSEACANETEEEEDIVADIERLAKYDEEVEREKTKISPRFAFRSKICGICDKPFKPFDFIIKLEGEGKNYCPKCARGKLLSANDRASHGRYLEYICKYVDTWTLAHLVVDKSVFSELDNGLYELKCYKRFSMKRSKMLYGRRKYIYETVDEFAENTISNCVLEKNDDFTCLFFNQFGSEKEEYFVEPEGKLKDMMDYLSEWTGKDVNLIVDRNGYVRGFICGSETCDESLIMKEYYRKEFIVKMVGYLD